MGCHHDLTYSNSNSTFAYGYTNPDNEFRTIMAYNCPGRGCQRLQRFSTPDQRFAYYGKPIGSNQRDNVRQINISIHAVAKFRHRSEAKPNQPDNIVSFNTTYFEHFKSNSGPSKMTSNIILDLSIGITIATNGM